jgi:hypothetical protein
MWEAKLVCQIDTVSVDNVRFVVRDAFALSLASKEISQIYLFVTGLPSTLFENQQHS